MMHSSIVRISTIALSFFVAQAAVTQIGDYSHLRGQIQTPSRSPILRIQNDSHLQGNNHAPTMMPSVIQIETTLRSWKEVEEQMDAQS